MRKLGFPLKVEDGWPPWDVEHVWVEDEIDGVRICNIPFFIKDLALGDVVAVTSEDGLYATTWDHVRRSTNSTVWIIARRGSDTVTQQLQSIGCEVEGGALPGHFAINVPASVVKATFESAVDRLINEFGVEAAFPAYRE